MADRSSSSEYASDKAWNSYLLLIAVASSPTGMCSFLLNLAHIAVLSTMHHHGRCGVSESFSTRDLRGRGVAQGRPTGKPMVEGSEITACFGRPVSLACSGDLQLIR